MSLEEKIENLTAVVLHLTKVMQAQTTFNVVVPSEIDTTPGQVTVIDTEVEEPKKKKKAAKKKKKEVLHETEAETPSVTRRRFRNSGHATQFHNGMFNFHALFIWNPKEVSRKTKARKEV